MRHLFLVFSGFNHRAILALCRALRLANCEVGIVASGRRDPIWETALSELVIFSRTDLVLDTELFGALALSQSMYDRITVCPSSEFLNQFLITNRFSLPECFHVPLVDGGLYQSLSNKKAAIEVMCDGVILKSPKEIDGIPQQSSFPFVAKPRHNLSSGRTLHPYLILSAEEFDRFVARERPNDFFFQELVDGRSYYYCFYFSYRTGASFTFVQENLCQEPNGKSILWARKARKPDEELRQYLENLLTKIGFSGWLMVEIFTDGRFNYFIEINPRLWGPLQLSIDHCPAMLSAFIHDCTNEIIQLSANSHRQYCWVRGLTSYLPDINQCKWYTEQPKELSAFMDSMREWDVERCE